MDYPEFIKNLFFNIKTRLPSGRFFILTMSLLLLEFRKMMKVQFDSQCDDGGGKIDVVIPTVSKDYALLGTYLKALHNLCHKINKIYIVSYRNDDIVKFAKDNNCVFVDELSVLGYGKDAIRYVADGIDRSGWMFQQLLKLSGEKFVEMENYVIVDSDTLLINKHAFIEDGKFVFFENSEWNDPYFESFERMFGYKTKNRLSMTSHMMIFNTANLKAMKAELEAKHGKSWDKVYLDTIDEKIGSCVSDYDTYANWVLCNHPEQMIRRPFYNKAFNRKYLAGLDELEKKYSGKYKSISFHSYIK